jgi:hypothetical protein
MRQQNSVFARGPFKDFRISFAEQTGILDANDIERGQESEQTADNAVVEVFVHREAKHDLALRVALQEAFAKACWIGPRFVELTHSIMFLSPLFQVFIDGTSVLQVVTDRCIDVGKRQRGVLLKNFFGRRALIEGVHDGSQTDAGAFHAHDSVFVSEQRRRISRNLQGHDSHFIMRLIGSLAGFLGKILGTVLGTV